MKDAVEKEWSRLESRLRRNGPADTSKYVVSLIRTGNYPLWYPYRLAEHLLRKGEFLSAGTLLDGIRQFGEEHYLVDMLYGKWLWGNGDRKAAVRFVARKARFWSKSGLFDLLAAMYSVSGKKKQAQHYLQIAGSLAEEELARANAHK